MPIKQSEWLIFGSCLVVLALLAGGGFTPVSASHPVQDKAKWRDSNLAKRFKGNVASVGGKVLTVQGKAISNAQIGLYNADTDQWIYARTGSFGHYTFHDLPLSDFYVIVVIHKRYLFLDGSRTFTLEGNMFDVDFVASAVD